jgi:putrescine---pyruvate transaminase
VRGQGLIAAVEVVADKSTRSLFPAEAGMTQKLTDAMLERGVYTRVAMDCICIAPPLVTTDAQLDRIVETVGDAVTQVVGAVKKSLPLAER